MVLDNAESWQALQGHLPLGGTAHAYLVTTRERDFAGAQFQHLPLGILSDDSARELLRKLMGGRAAQNPQEVEVLVAAFAGHALALEIAGAYLRRHRQARAEDLAQRLPRKRADRDLDEVAYGRDFDAMLDELLGVTSTAGLPRTDAGWPFASEGWATSKGRGLRPERRFESRFSRLPVAR